MCLNLLQNQARLHQQLLLVLLLFLLLMRMRSKPRSKLTWLYVVSNLKELEASFSHMLVQVKRLLVLNKCDLSDALLFLDSVIGSEDFIACDNFDKLMRQIQRDHISVFNISILQQLVACFDNQEPTKVIEAYNEKKRAFSSRRQFLSFNVLLSAGWSLF